MKITADHLWPLILHFVQEYFGQEDLAAFKTYFKLQVEHADDPLVKAGGIKAILSGFFKQNKSVYKQFKKAVEKPKKKRVRSQSNASESEASQPKKRQRKDSNVSEASAKPKMVLPPKD